MSVPSPSSQTSVVSCPFHFCTGTSLPPSSVTMDLTFLSSAVVSSNSTPSLKLIWVLLKVFCVCMVIVSPFTLMIVEGLVVLATCLVAKPTPEGRGKVMSTSWNRPGRQQTALRPRCGKEEGGGQEFSKAAWLFLNSVFVALCYEETLLIPLDK